MDGFVICRGRYPAPISDEMILNIKNVAQKIATSFGLKDTPMLIQMKVNEDKISVIEFCARTGGGIKYRLLPKVSGFDVVKAVVDLTCGEKPHVKEFNYNRYVIDEFLYCKSGIIDHYEGFEELLEEGVVSDYDIYKPIGYEFGNISCSGDRAAYFSVEADSFAELEKKHRLAGEKVKIIDAKGEDLIRHDIIRFIK